MTWATANLTPSQWQAALTAPDGPLSSDPDIRVVQAAFADIRSTPEFPAFADAVTEAFAALQAAREGLPSVNVNTGLLGIIAAGVTLVGGTVVAAGSCTVGVVATLGAATAVCIGSGLVAVGGGLALVNEIKNYAADQDAEQKSQCYQLLLINKPDAFAYCMET